MRISGVGNGELGMGNGSRRSYSLDFHPHSPLPIPHSRYSSEENRMKKTLITSLTVALFALVVSQLSTSTYQSTQKPDTIKLDYFDTNHRTVVADPNRWLEDDNSKDTARWVEEQNKVTFGYLEKIPFRAKIKGRLERLYNYPKISAPFRKGDLYFFAKNDGLQNQSVLYVQTGLEGKPEVLIDPNKWSEDGTTRLGAFARSKDGKSAAYGVSRGGSDWQEYYVMEVASRKVLPDTLQWVKVSGMAWQGDGFYYSRYPEPPKGRELSTKNENHQVYFHKVGTAQSEDEMVYQDPAYPQRFHNVGTTEDERFAILSVSDRGTGKNGNAVFYRDLKWDDKAFKPIVTEIANDSFGVIDNVGDKFLIRTDKDAPNGKVVLYDPKTGKWSDALPEKAEPLQGVGTAGGKLFATYLKDVATRPYVYSLDGKPENEIELPGPGTADGFGGNSDDKFVFYSFTSMNYPPTIFRYDIAAKKSTL